MIIHPQRGDAQEEDSSRPYNTSAEKHKDKHPPTEMHNPNLLNYTPHIFVTALLDTRPSYSC